MAQPVKYQGVDKQSSGYKLLAAMGWQEGSGLVSLSSLYACDGSAAHSSVSLRSVAVAGSKAAGY